MKVTFDIATSQDDALLRYCLKENTMEGSISLAFEAEPSFFKAVSVQGKESQVLVARTQNHSQIAGLGLRSIKPLHVNNEIKNIGYLSGLRLSPGYRHSIHLARGYQFLKQLDADQKVPFYLTTILEENEKVIKLLESNRADLPTYHYLSRYNTYYMKAIPEVSSKNYTIRQATQKDLSNLLAFLNREGKRKTFFPYLEINDFQSTYLMGLQVSDFYLAYDQNECVGVLAKWDQSSFKQTRVMNYSQGIKVARPLANMVSSWTRLPKLPKVGSLLRYYYLSFVAIKKDNPDILTQLIAYISSQNNGYDLFTLGLCENDPLTKAFENIKAKVLKSNIYLVSFDKQFKMPNAIKEKTLYLELATL